MRKLTLIKLFFVLITVLLYQSSLFADDNHHRGHQKRHCDVVSLSGSGKLLENGQITGTEVLTIIGRDKQIDMKFSATTLGILGVDPESKVTNLSTSHDFSGVKNRRINFTTFDELTVIPLLGDDPGCQRDACGLIFKLKLETGHGRYNCSEIVSGINTDPQALIPFTSYINPAAAAANGDTVILNSMGKLCRCKGHD